MSDHNAPVIDKPTEPISPAQLITVMTTEHFTLQTARGSTIADANGRASLFLNAVSSGLVALAFVGQAMKIDSTAFLLFGIVLFGSLLFMGLVTFVRVLETGIEDMVYARGISRIRHYYTEIAPHLKDYFVLPINDDLETTMRGTMGLIIPRIQTLLTSAGLISVINSVLAAVLVAMLLALIAAPSLTVLVVFGLVVLLVMIALQTRYQQVQWAIADRSMTSMFPASSAKR